LARSILALRQLAAATGFFLVPCWLFTGAALLWLPCNAILVLSWCCPSYLHPLARHWCCSRSMLLLGLPWHCTDLAWCLASVSRARCSLYQLSDFLLALAWCGAGVLLLLASGSCCAGYIQLLALYWRCAGCVLVLDPLCYYT
jgi:hypothetical protein